MNTKTLLAAAASSAAIVAHSRAYADDAGDKSEEFSDSAKMDKLMDMIGDACAKMDAVGSRMDGFEERMAKADARLDAIADAGKKDEDEEDKDKKADAEDEEDKDKKADAEDEEDKDKPKEPAADKKKDAKADEGDDKDKDEPKADSVARAGLESVRADIARIAAAMPKALTDDERARFAAIQEGADAAFRAFGDRAGPPLDGETELAYQRRLVGKLQKHSPQWAKARLAGIADADALDAIAGQVYADSIVAARRGADLPAGQLRRIEKNSGHGHTIYEYEGDSPAAWMDGFAGNHQKSTGDFRRP